MLRLYSFRRALALCLISLVMTPLPGVSLAQQGLKGSTVITSKRLLADSRANSALFEGSVVAKNSDMTLYSDKMTVYYSEAGDVEKIIAYGNVKLIKKEQVVTSEHAEYYAVEQKVVFTENPRAVEGGNVVTGSKMTYLLNEDRSIVEDSKVYLEGEK
jgi:lipopolysaccharide export system protein LptA